MRRARHIPSTWTVNLGYVVDDVEVVVDRVSTVLYVLHASQRVAEDHTVVIRVAISQLLRICAICSALRSGPSHRVALAVRWVGGRGWCFHFLPLVSSLGIEVVWMFLLSLLVAGQIRLAGVRSHMVVDFLRAIDWSFNNSVALAQHPRVREDLGC